MVRRWAEECATKWQIAEIMPNDQTHFVRLVFCWCERLNFLLERLLKIVSELRICAHSHYLHSPKNLTMEITNYNDQLSAAWAISIGRSLHEQGMTADKFNYELFSITLKAAMSGAPLPMDPAEAGQVLQGHMARLADQKAEENAEEGKKFLEENAKKEGVVVTDSGLQYLVIRDGDGDKPSATSNVTTHYHGTYTTGEVFDSSYQRGQPASFALNQVIKGWTEGLQLMPVGAKYRFFIPSELAYGEAGAGGAIEPNAALIFDVELISIN